MTTTTKGRGLADDLAKECPETMDWFEYCAELSLLHRRAKAYATIQERWCCEEMSDSATKALERREAGLERLMREQAERLGWGVKFTGDPRGFCTRVLLPSKRYNTWGGEEEGWGIA